MFGTICFPPLALGACLAPTACRSEGYPARGGAVGHWAEATVKGARRHVCRGREGPVPGDGL
eukprot:4969817-Pyramimonas_sp.AAC.1